MFGIRGADAFGPMLLEETLKVRGLNGMKKVLEVELQKVALLCVDLSVVENVPLLAICLGGPMYPVAPEYVCHEPVLKPFHFTGRLSYDPLLSRLFLVDFVDLIPMRRRPSDVLKVT
jgi:hypothetical protein